jgi:hypothetical protein
MVTDKTELKEQEYFDLFTAGSNWKLQNPIAPKQITFTEIATKAVTPGQKDTSQQSTKAPLVNPYIKQFEAWTKNVSKLNTVTRKYTTFFSLKLPPAKVVDLAPDGGCSSFTTALMALRTVDPDIVVPIPFGGRSRRTKDSWFYPTH